MDTISIERQFQLDAIKERNRQAAARSSAKRKRSRRHAGHLLSKNHQCKHQN